MLAIHKKIVEEELNELRKNPKVVSILLYGSIARGTANKTSDVDIEIVWLGKYQDLHHFRYGIKVDTEYWPRDTLLRRVKKYPFLSYPYLEEKILYDPTGFARRIKVKLRKYFKEHPAVMREWRRWTKEYLEFKKKGIQRTNKEKIESCKTFYDRLEVKYSQTHKITRRF
jgi:predicted nucleotidyltransferase